MDFSALSELAIAAVSLLTTVGTALAAVWLFFRRRLQAWWKPYRDGFAGAAQVPSLKADLCATRGEVEQVGKALGLLTMHVRARGDTNIEQAEFETDGTGANTFVNLTYARWLGVGKGELQGWGWVNFVHPDDRVRVRREWDSCRLEHRVYNVRYRLLEPGGDDFLVDAIATPIPEAPPARQWIGVIRKVVS